jgi:DNA polymerase III alpha subunit
MERGDYPHLVLASSIIRPAANRYINEYVERLKGKPYTALLPSIEETLEESQGIMVYQEDVSRVAIAVAGFSAAEADGLRKVLSRKDREQRLAAYRDRFFAGGKRAGIEVTVLKELWDMILSFDGYSFCKSHSASYALVSYKLAYLKLNYPLEFLCSVINNGGGFYGRQVYLNLVRRLGFEVRGPDVNRSALLYSVEASALRIGLRQIKELSDSFLLRLIEEREEGGPYESIRDFVRRLGPAYREMRMLIRSGALDSLAGTLSRPQLFWYFVQIEKQDEKDELFSFSPQPPDCIKDYREISKIHDEIKTLGLIISRHPLKVFTSRIEMLRNSDAAYPYISSREITSYRGKRVSIPGIMVTGKEVLTKKREAMCFVSFEDPEGVFETVFFPKAYEELELLLDAGRAFIVSGLVKEELGAYAVHVEGLRPLNRKA